MMAERHDTIDRDIFQYQIVGVAEEMSRALRRSAYSPVIWDMYDYACALFSTKGEMLAQSRTIPAQLGTMGTALEHMIGVIPLERWRPGDVLVCNDPYRGCTHTMDITLFSPIFSRGELIAISSTIAHHIDIGGAVPCSISVELGEMFGEGLIFPPMKLIDAGRPNETAFDFVAANVRDPRACLGDLRAQIAGCTMAERRVVELTGRYGNDGFRDLSAECLDYGERYVRKVIAGFGDGRREAEVLVEDGVASDERLRIKVAVEIAGDEIAIDFEGTSDQRAFALNCPWSSTVSLTTYAVKCLTSPDIPQNDGCNRPVRITAPFGSLVNPQRPAAVGHRHYIAQSVADAVLKALSPLAPERSSAGCQIAFSLLLIGGKEDRPAALRMPGRSRSYQIMDTVGGGMGGHASGDGMSAVDVHGSNCGILSAEVMETLSPIRVLSSKLVSGSGGDGEHRGGLSIERDYELLADSAVFSSTLQQANDDTTPWGAHGGGPGGAALAVLNAGTKRERVLPARSPATTMRRGDTIRLRAAGGGGFGDPAARKRKERDHDRAEGLV
jgi:N-methylhydantoinase B